MGRFSLLLLCSLLGACGLIPLPEVQGKDFYFINTVPNVQPHEVVYSDLNHLDSLTLPRAPYRHVTVDAVLTTNAATPQGRVQIFAFSARPSCPLVLSPAPYAHLSAALRCSGPAGGQLVAEVTMKPGTDTPVHLEGAALDEAVRAGTLYLGVRVLSREDTFGLPVYVGQIRVRARL